MQTYREMTTLQDSTEATWCHTVSEMHIHFILKSFPRFDFWRDKDQWRVRHLEGQPEGGPKFFNAHMRIRKFLFLGGRNGGCRVSV